jgi:hypothetical protein
MSTDPQIDQRIRASKQVALMTASMMVVDGATGLRD